MSVTIDEQAMKKTRERRRYYIAFGAFYLVLGVALLAYGLSTLSCTPSCQYSSGGFSAGTFGGVLLGGGVATLVLGLLLGRSVYVTK